MATLLGTPVQPLLNALLDWFLCSASLLKQIRRFLQHALFTHSHTFQPTIMAKHVIDSVSISPVASPKCEIDMHEEVEISCSTSRGR